MLSPTITAIAEDYAGKVQVGKLNIDTAQNIAAKYGVMSIPTVIFSRTASQSRRRSVFLRRMSMRK
jgi:thioredoxin 1